MKRSFYLFVLLLCACAPTLSDRHWQHSGTAPPLQLERDRADCHMYLDAAQQDSQMTPPHRTVREWDDEFIACMAERGWQLAPAAR